MKTLSPQPRVVALVTSILSLCACDTEPAPDAEGLAIEFRDDYSTTGTKNNTGFLGEGEDLPMNFLPYGDVAVGGIQINEIRGTACAEPAGIFAGELSTNGTDIELSVSADGELQPLTVKNVADPSHECTFEGALWARTYWEISVDDGNGTVYDTDLYLAEVDVDEHGRHVYQWEVNYWRIDPSAPRPEYRPVCDEDTDVGADPTLRYHAYLVPGLQVDDTTGDLTIEPVPTSAFMACRSGALGKALAWGYSPSTFDVDTHELATRMVRADYCGDGTTHTQSGTPVWVESEIVAADADAPALGSYEVEAVWDLDVEHASCVTLPRREEHEYVGPEFTCPDGVTTLPPCDSTHFNAPGVIVTTHTPL